MNKPSAVPGVDPSAVNTRDEMAKCLDGLRRRRGLSYEQLEAHARHLNKRDSRWEIISKSTVGEIVKGQRLPSRSKMLTFLTVCEVSRADLPQWLAAWERAGRADAEVAGEAGLPGGAAEAGPPVPSLVLMEYLSRVQEYFQQLNLEMLLTMTSVEERLRVPLQRVFIPPFVRADPPAVELPREFRRRLLDGDETDLRAMPRDLELEVAASTRHAYDQQQPRPVFGLLEEEEHRCMVLVGDPGSGKSTTARYIVLRLAQLHPALGHAASSDSLAGLAGALPLLIELRLYGSSGCGSFLDYLEQLHEAQGLGLPRQELTRHLDGGLPVVVLFDGLDEVIDRDRRATLYREIREFSRRYPNARIVVTSRPVGYQRQVLDDAGFMLYQLQDLDSGQIDTFVRAWYRIASADDQAEAERLADRLVKAVERSRAVNELAGNPLLLTLLCVMGRRRELPRDRAHVYEYAVSLLVEHWDVEAHSFPNDEGLLYEDKLDLLRLLARRMLLSEGALGGNRVTERELRETFEDYLENERGYEQPVARAGALSMITQLRTRNYILSRFGAGMYGFVHRAFLEYLAALDLAKRFDDRLLDEDALLDTCETYGADPAWTEVLLLLVRMKERFAGKMLDRLLLADQAWRFDDGYAPTRSILCFRALNEIRPSARLTPQVVAVLARLVEIVRELEFVPDGSLQAALRDALVSTFSRLGHTWPGADVYRSWYSNEGRYLTGPVARLTAELNAPLTSERQLIRDARFDPDPLIRSAAVNALGAQRDWSPEALAELVHRLEADSSSEVRVASVRALGSRWSRDASVCSLLQAYAESDDDADVRQTCLEVLNATWGTAPETYEITLRRAENDEDPRVRAAAVAALTRTRMNDPAAIALTGRLLSEDLDAEVRQVAAQGMVHSTTDLIVSLNLLAERAAVDRHRSVRRAAMRALGATGTKWPGVPPLLAERAVVDLDAGVRQAALEGLVACRPGAVETRRLVTDRAESDSHWSVRRTALQLLSGVWSYHPDTMPLLERRATDDSDEDVRTAALLGASSPLLDEAGSAADLLMDAYISDPSASVRERIVDMLVDTDMDPGVVRDWLLNVLSHDPEYSVRRRAALVVSSQWPKEDSVREAIFRRAADDPDADVRRQALFCIGEHWRTTAHGFLVERASEDSSDLVRRAALGCLLMGWRDDPLTFSLLKTHAEEDEDESLRRAALQALGATWPKDLSVQELLTRAASSDVDWSVRRTAVTLRAEAGDQPSVDFVIVQSSIDPSPDVRRAAIQSLATLRGDRSAVLRHLTAVAVDDPSATVRVAALRGLATDGGNQATLLELVTRLSIEDPHAAVREAAAHLRTRFE